jgi:hypothetical protein
MAVPTTDLNSSPSVSVERFIIDLDDLDEAEARKWPDLLDVVKALVRPLRAALPDTRTNSRLRESWWRYSQGREVRQATKGMTSRPARDDRWDRESPRW